MAKKKTRTTTTSTSNYSLVKVCAFWGIVLAGIAGLISFILNVLGKCGVTIAWGGKVAGACNLISTIALFISAWLAAWDYVKGKSQTWKVIFWVFFVLALLGVLGIGIWSWF
ncbi:MAG: hypothetical protein K2K04_04070 [Clostridia bacterium]|nr:hypothetical protein [Clostridia bacterium]